MELPREDLELDFSLTMETRQSRRGRNKKKYNPYVEDFVVDRIVLDDVADSVVGLDEIVVSQNVDLIDDTETDWIDNRSEPETEFEHEVEQMHEQELTNLQVLEWLHDISTYPKETIPTIQAVNQISIKYISHDDNTESNWIAQNGLLCALGSNFDLLDSRR